MADTDRPSWCPYEEKACIQLRGFSTELCGICGGKLSKPEKHGDGMNTHRFCIHTEGQTFHFRVNKEDVKCLSWIFEVFE